jgi:formylglycine-generating enzyme required for sulfatase activity
MCRAIASLMLVVGVWVCPETAWGQSGKNGSTVPPPPGSTSGKQSQPASQFGVKSVKSTKSGVSLPVEGVHFSGSGLPTHKGTNAVFRWISPGTFQMGSTAATDNDRNDDETLHKVKLNQGFWLLDHEVTLQEYKDIRGSIPPAIYRGDDHPVQMVAWNAAADFCDKLTEKDRKAGRISLSQRYRLPTEAEWEYACRAGTTTAVYYNVGDRNKELDEIAWWDWNSDQETHPIKLKRPNSFGLYDMIGNVSEWCSDWYDANYPSGDVTVTDPTGPPSGSFRVLRGGSWFSNAGYSRSAVRNKTSPLNRLNDLGFRPALSSSVP